MQSLDRAQAVIWKHPRILAGPRWQPVTALATGGRDGRIVACGPLSDVRCAVGNATEVELPDGGVVIPGMVDAHLHLAQYARSLDEVDLRGAPNLTTVLHRVAERARLRSGVVTGAGWEWQKWTDAREPTRHDLDAIVADRPVILESQDRHTCWVNTAFLDAVRLDHGSGILREHVGWDAKAALQQVPGCAVPPLVESLRRAVDNLAALGVTCVHDMDGEESRAAVLELAARGELPIRVVSATRLDALAVALQQRRRSAASLWGSSVIEGPVKVFSDGALGSQTCQMCATFGDATNHGVSSISDNELDTVIATCQQAGLAVAIHAIGDRANQRCLDAIERQAPGRESGVPHRIEHAQFLRPIDVRRFADLNVVASMQPLHAITDKGLVDELLGTHDLAAYAWRSLVSAGTVVAFGTDAPVEEPRPFVTLDAAIHRAPFHVGAEPWQPAERLDPAAALRAHTAAGWTAAGWGGHSGELTVGQFGDFVVIDRDPFSGDRLFDAQVLTTVVAGQIVSPRRVA